MQEATQLTPRTTLVRLLKVSAVMPVSKPEYITRSSRREISQLNRDIF